MHVKITTQCGTYVPETDDTRLYKSRHSLVLRCGEDRVIKAVTRRFDVKDNELSKQQQICKQLMPLRLPHVHVVDKCWTRDDVDYFESMYMPNGDLLDLLSNPHSPVSDACKMRMAIQITDGVYELHSVDVVHRDLKPDNILLDNNNNCYVSDFDLAEIASECVLEAGCAGPGSRRYGAPELFSFKHEHDEEYDGKKADIWSLAITLVGLFTCCLPFVEANCKCVHYYNWKECNMQPDCFRHLPSKIVPIVSDMLQINPVTRPDAHTVLTRLKAI